MTSDRRNHAVENCGAQKELRGLIRLREALARIETAYKADRCRQWSYQYDDLLGKTIDHAGSLGVREPLAVDLLVSAARVRHAETVAERIENLTDCLSVMARLDGRLRNDEADDSAITP